MIAFFRRSLKKAAIFGDFHSSCRETRADIRPRRNGTFSLRVLSVSAERHFSRTEETKFPRSGLRREICSLFSPSRSEIRETGRATANAGKHFPCLTFSIYLLFRSAILAAGMSRGDCTECARDSEIEIVVLHFARLQQDAYYFNERCSLASGYLIGRSAW